VTLLAGLIILYAFLIAGYRIRSRFLRSSLFIGSFMLQHTKFGRRIYAMGGNEEAARYPASASTA
jgi:ABC-type xylose transport system permease subunit